MDLFSTNYLTGVVNSLQVPPQALVNRFFGAVQTETSEEIHFDVEADVMGLAPFVSPVVEGKVMTNLGFVTKTFKPAYVKPKNVWQPGRALKRAIGESLTGSLSPMQRMQLLVANNLADHRKMVDRRLEWMAASVLSSGSITVSGDLYQTSVVDFGRAAGHTITLSGGSRWNQAGVNPLDDLQTWSDLILQNSGSSAMDVIMDVSVWKVFRENTYVKSRLDLQKGVSGPSLDQGKVTEIGLSYKGNVDGWNIWVYVGYYKNDSGTVVPMLPAGTVLMVGDIGGVRAFGAIQDEQAGIQALPFFSKSWVTQDPGSRFVMTQSAPLLVPYRPNASLSATVI